METSAQQALKAAQLAELVGQILDDYIQAQSVVISEFSSDFLESNEQLLQRVDNYRGRFEDLIGISANTKERAELQAYIQQQREERDA